MANAKKAAIDDDFAVVPVVPEASVVPVVPEAPEAAEKKTSKVFIPKDDMNPADIKYVGWLNGQYYEYPRGAVSEIPVNIAAEIISIGGGHKVN